MIALFMIYSILAGAGLALAAQFAERALRLYGFPTRWVWVAALAGVVCLPQLFLSVPEMAWDPFSASNEMATAVYSTAAPFRDARYADAGLETGLRAVWVGLSLLGLFVLVASGIRLALWQRRWREGVVAGCKVLVSDNVGPAVVGMGGQRIVVPGWVLRAEEQVQRLLLAHEQEHLRARDPLVAAVVMTALIAMPWNPALWWIANRLRLAMEVDCDARVLRGLRSDVGTYGNLLLEVGRRAAGLAAPVMSFSRPRSQLEHRIEAMTRPAAVPGRISQTVGALSIVLGSLVFVWATPFPVFGLCSGAQFAPAEVQSHAPTPGVVIGVRMGAPKVIRTLPAAGG